MATLEVHDSRGRVEYVTISRENPALFGADPKCDVVLDDPEVRPFHGRFRWKEGRFKAEAMPEVSALVINGKRVLSASFRQGDEIRVGSCRIFMLNPDDNAPDTEKTRVAPKPEALGRLEGDWARNLAEEDDSPREPEKPARREMLTRSRRGTATATAEAKAAKEAPKAPPIPPWKQLLKAITKGDAPPGKERVATSPLVLILAGSLVVLAGLSYALWNVIAKRSVEFQYRTSVDLLTDGDYLNAMKSFDEFLKNYPQEPRAGKARVLRELANVKQFTSGGGAAWSDALTASREMVRSVGELKEYRDSSADLAEVVLKVAEGLADRARAAADPKSLDEARQAVALHERISGKAAPGLRARTRLPAKLIEAEAAVRKGLARASALAAMDAAIKGNRAIAVFDARDALLAQYADLAADRAVVDRLKKGNDLLRLAVTADAAKRAAERTPALDPLGPPTTLVLRSPPAKAAAVPGSPPLVYALSEGFAYALNGATGAPVWHVPVGPSAPFPPQPLAGAEPTAIVFDARHDELVRLKARNGELLWRQPLGERIADPPLVLGNQVFQTTPSGKLLSFDLVSGELRGTLDFKRPLTRTPASDESGKFLYVMADEASLFIVSREPMACVGVEYLGHDHAAIACAPLRLGRYLIVAENFNLADSRWRILLLDEDGEKMREVQQVPVSGWTWSVPATLGSVVWAAGDRGGLTAYAIGPYDAKQPFQKIASVAPDAKASGPSFGRARTDRELWLSSGRTARFDIDVKRGTLSSPWTFMSAGPALAPIQTAAGLAVLTQQSAEGRGAAALYGVNPGNGAVVWRTVLGAPWPVDPAVAPDGESLAVIGLDGAAIALTKSKLAAGGFVESTIPGPAQFRLPPGPHRRLDGDGLTVLVPPNQAQTILVREGTGPLKPIDLPAPLAAAPLLLWGGLLVPGVDGRVYLVDPRTGGAKADPYVPPYDRTKPTRWLAPVPIEGDAVALADTSGRIRRLARKGEPRPMLATTGEEANLASPIVADPASTGTSVLVATGDGKVRALAGRDLSPLDAWSLEAPRAFGPSTVGPIALVADASGGALACGADGRRLWTVPLAAGPPVGPPAVRDDSFWFLNRDGSLERRTLADGTEVDRLPLGVVPAGGPVVVGGELLIPTGPGTIRPMADAAKSAP